MLSDMGFKKSLLCVGGLLLAVGGPISMFSASDFVGQRAEELVFRLDGQGAGQSAVAVPSTGRRQRWLCGKIPLPFLPPMLTPLPSLDEVLSFDRSVEWVMQRWPRVSTGLTYLQLQGYRVPLVTGTGLSDVAGSLTYYFNAGQQVQRITFRGTTGDPTPLGDPSAGRYHFARRLTNDPGLVLYEVVDSGNKPAGTLKIRSARVVKASQPYTRFEVDLAMDRPE